MNYLSLLFALITIIALIFNFWISHTKSGRKWLKEL